MRIILTITIILLLGAIGYTSFTLFQDKSELPLSNNKLNNNEPPANDGQPPPNEEPPQVTPLEISLGNRQKNQVIFTFDAGAGANSLSKFLDILAQHNIKGTFFLTGKWAEQNPALVKNISAGGYEIYNHTYSHPHLTQSTDSQIVNELNKANEIIQGITGLSTKPFFRPPYGDRDERVIEVAGKAGYQSVYWTIDALDWKEGMTEEQVKSRIMDNLQPGAIYLMHVGDDITGNILDDIFTQIENKGYKITSLSEGIK